MVNSANRVTNSIVGTHCMLRDALHPLVSGMMVEGGSAYADAPRSSPPAPQITSEESSLANMNTSDQLPEAMAECNSSASTIETVLPTVSIGTVAQDEATFCYVEESSGRVVEPVVETIFYPGMGYAPTVTGYRVVMDPTWPDPSMGMRSSMEASPSRS